MSTPEARALYEKRGYMDTALWKEALNVAREIIPGWEESPERQRLGFGHGFPHRETGRGTHPLSAFPVLNASRVYLYTP